MLHMRSLCHLQIIKGGGLRRNFFGFVNYFLKNKQKREDYAFNIILSKRDFTYNLNLMTLV